MASEHRVRDTAGVNDTPQAGPAAAEMLIARNPDPQSRLQYLLRIPIDQGLVFRTSDVWPRTKALFCYPVPSEHWPERPEIVERAPIRSCARRGAAIDLILDRGRENRSQIVFTTARGRDAVFWQSPRTRKQARPNVRTPTARAAGLTDLTIVIDTHERYPYRFTGQQVHTVSGALPCGDYALRTGDRLLASVERKSLPDLISSLTNGKLRFALAELAALPRAAVVIEDRYSAVFKLERVRPAVVADALAELQIRYPTVPIVFCENRQLAEEWTYRYLAAARHWCDIEDTDHRPAPSPPTQAPTVVSDTTDTGPSSADVRAWARATGLDVPARGRPHPRIWDAWRNAHPE